MKKVLFATTALVAFAGYASADIALSGVAQMGIQGGESSDVDGTGVDAFGAEQETQFVQDIDITFTMSGTADNGLTFGAAIDLDENAGNVGTDDAGVAIFVSGEWGTLTLGDTDGALDWAMQEVALGGASINDNETSHAGYRGAYLDGSEDGQILRYDYSFGDFGVAFSIEQDDDANNAVSVAPYAATGLSVFPLDDAFVTLTTTGTTSIVAPNAQAVAGVGVIGTYQNNGLAPFSNGITDINRMDFDLDGDGAFDIIDGTVNLGNAPELVTFAGGNSIFVDGIWQGGPSRPDANGANAFGGTTGIDVLDTLMAVGTFSNVGSAGFAAAYTPVDNDYVIRSSATPAGNISYTGDVTRYLDESDFDYAIGLKYDFDMGGGTLTVGGGYQQGGTIVATSLMQTIGGVSSMVSSGTDLTLDVAATGPGDIELWESISGAEQTEYGLSASFAMDNGFSAGFQWTHIENAAGMSYSIATTGGTATATSSAVVTNAVFTDATHWGIGAAYEFDAITVAANYGQLDYDHAAFPDQSGYGLVGQYDFGGGLSAHLGYGYSEVGAADASNWSFGLSMSF